MNALVLRKRWNYNRASVTVSPDAGVRSHAPRPARCESVHKPLPVSLLVTLRLQRSDDTYVN